MNTETGKYLVFAGATLVLIGGIVYFFHHKLNWLGNLPGDIRIERPNFRFYFPFTTMLLLSLLLNVIIRIFRRF